MRIIFNALVLILTACTNVQAVNHAYIDIVSRVYDVDQQLIRAIITVESGWDQDAVSLKGAVGLMQLKPSTAMDMGILNINDPYLNIHAGVRYIRYLMDRFGRENIHLILSGYNAGPTITARSMMVPNYPETKKYIAKVLREYNTMVIYPRRLKIRVPPKQKTLPEIRDEIRNTGTKGSTFVGKSLRGVALTQQFRGCSCLGRRNRNCKVREVWSW